jgi:HEAT repeat protein
MTPSGHIFFSYPTLESEFAMRLAADLKQAGLNLWVDRLEGGIRLGDDWVQRLEIALNNCAGLIAVLSPGYVESSYCRRELKRAVAFGRPVYPVLAALVDRASWPLEIEERQFIDFREWRNESTYRERFERLVETLRGDARVQFASVPDRETRYLLNVIAEFEGHRGVLEYIDAPAETAAERPNPRRERGWPEEFAVLNERLDSGGDASKPVLFDSIHQVAAQHPSFVLLGPPGAGKTTAVRRLALDIARRRLESPQLTPLPLLLDLSQWAQEASPLDCIQKHWPFPSEPSQALSRGDVFLYLDGLNEMGGAGPANAGKLKEWFAGKGAPSHVIVTCRDSSYSKELELGLATVRISELRDEDIELFVAAYMGRAKSRRLLETLLNQEGTRSATPRPVSALIRNPYLLTALIYLYLSAPDHELPRNVGGLFRDLVKLLWKREESKRIPGWLPFEEMQLSLSRLAMTMIEEDKPASVPLEYALRFVNRGLMWAAQGANFLIVAGDHVRFYHQHVQDYFAAAGFEQSSDFDWLQPPPLHRETYGGRDWIDTPHSVYGFRVTGKWDMAASMLAGFTAKPAPLLERIARLDPILAGKCIAAFPEAPADARQFVLAALLNGLRGSGVGLALQCAWQLRELKDDSVVPDLLETLSSGSEHSRLFSALVLASIPDTRAIPRLIRALADTADVYLLGRVSEEAAKALAAMPEWNFAPLSRAITDADENVRAGAATALGGCGAVAVPALVEALHDPAAAVRAAAARALGKIGDRSAAAALAACLFDTAHPPREQSVGDAAAEALREMGAASTAIPVIEEGIRQGQPLRYTIIEILQEPAALPILEHAILHGDSSLRLFAVRALERMKVSGGSGLVAKVLEDRDVSVRRVAAEVLANLGWTPSNTGERVRLAIAGPNWDECIEMGTAAVPHLLRLLDDPAEFIRKEVMYTLARIKDESVVPHLIRRLQEDSSKDVRTAAAVALISIASDEAIAAVSAKIIELLRKKREALEVHRWNWFDEEGALSQIVSQLENSKNPVAQAAAKKLEPKVLYGWRRPLGRIDPLDT